MNFLSGIGCLPTRFEDSTPTVRPVRSDELFLRTTCSSLLTRRGFAKAYPTGILHVALLPLQPLRSSSRAVPDFNGLDGVFKRPFQNAPADGPEHEAEHPPLKVLAVAYDDHVNIGRAVGQHVKV